ncbi:DNA repair XRCC4 [Brachionus plicatilis]|uniref:DNA repair XRCC4 n=1 Tax=Brachionus plicatilis TaxID=10195 RepID=A0A3M7R144_BRAPC|nr:DNA repair XRCC4 [Brachionus plicatilis]
MIKKELFTSFKYENNKRYSLLQIWNEENEDEFLKLILTDYLNYWIGKFSIDEIKNLSNLNDFDINGIILQFTEAFAKNFESFSIKLEGLETKKLELKKIVEGEIKVKVVSLELNIVNDSSLLTEEIFDYSIKKINHLQSGIESLDNEVKDLTVQKNEAVEALKECIDQKELIEFDLYSKFVEVLNEKKAKIRELTEANEQA